jgi:MFS family permease
VLPGALQDHFEKDLKISTSKFTLFISLYSWPNVVLCFFGGFLIDNLLGIQMGAIVFSCLVTVGQILFGYGAYCNKVWLMMVGRFIFGMGGETVSIAQKAYCVTWFPRNELNLVFGFIASAALLVHGYRDGIGDALRRGSGAQPPSWRAGGQLKLDAQVPT